MSAEKLLIVVEGHRAKAPTRMDERFHVRLAD